MTNFIAHKHPVLAVPCPDCRQKAGTWCIRPSGHKAMDLHKSRKQKADRIFIEMHGEDASIERMPDGSWKIDPRGRVQLKGHTQ